MLNQLLSLVEQPPGSLIYHLVILFAVEAALAMSYGQWRRERSPASARLAIGAGGILLARGAVLIGSLIVLAGAAPREILLPPLERAADTLTVLGLAWIFITMDDPILLRRNFTADAAAGSLIAVVLIGLLGSYYYWYFAALAGQMLNGTWLDAAWCAAQIIFALGGLAWMLGRTRYVYDPILKGVILAVLAGAAALQIVQPGLGDVSAPLRLGQLLALPMLAAVTYRHVVNRLLHWDTFRPSAWVTPTSRFGMQLNTPPEGISAPPSMSLEETRRAMREREEQTRAAMPIVPEIVAEEAPPPVAVAEKLEQTPAEQPSPFIPTTEILEALSGLLSTLEEREIARQAPKAVAIALRADVCALVIVDEHLAEAGVVGGYDNIAQTFLPLAVLDLGHHPGLIDAVETLRQIRLTGPRNSKELRAFYEQLEIYHEGPAYLQPLVNGEDRLGALVVGLPYSTRQLSDEERNLLDRLGPLVTAALINAEQHTNLREQVNRLQDVQNDQARFLSDDLAATRTDLEAAERQIEEMKAYIRDTHRQLETFPKQQESARLQVEGLQSTLEALQEEHERLLAQVEQVRSDGARSELLRQEVEHLAAERSRLARRVEEQQAEIDRLYSQEIALRAAARPDLARVDDDQLAARTEIASLRARLAEASISQQEIAFLQEQLAAKARETINLQTRLAQAQAAADALTEQISGAGAARGLGVMQARLEAQAAEMAALRADLAEARAAAAGPAQADHLHAEQMEHAAAAQLEAQLAERAALIEALETQLKEKAHAVGALTASLAGINGTLQSLEHQLSFKTGEVAELQASLAETRRQAQERINSLEAERRAGDTGKLERARAEMLEAELAEKGAQVSVLNDQLAAARQAIDALEGQLSAANRAFDQAIDGVQKVEAQDEVIASIAQELRTPMSSIMGYTELLLKESVGILGALQRKFLQRVKANTERMNALLDDLIRISSLDIKAPLAPESIEVRYNVEEAISAVMNQFRDKGLLLRLALAPELPELVTDRRAFLQVMGHLLSNAALASPINGEVQLCVEYFEEVSEPYLHVSVEDSGPGIAEEDLERVFIRRYRADSPLIEGLGDTGVSLALSRELIEAQGGRLWVEAGPGGGAMFRMVLPFSE